MDDFVTCHECGAAVPSAEQSRHTAWHGRLTQQLQQLEAAARRADGNIQSLDAGVQRVGAAVQSHRH